MREVINIDLSHGPVGMSCFTGPVKVEPVCYVVGKAGVTSWLSNSRPGATFVKDVCSIKITQELRHSGIPVIVICTLAAVEIAHNKGCGPRPPPSQKNF